VTQKSEKQAFHSERSLSLRLIRLRRKWFSASKRTAIIAALIGNLKPTTNACKKAKRF
jgi:hypothetical protein